MHVKTMLIMITLASALMWATLSVMARYRYPSLRPWAVGMGVQLVGYLLLSLRGQIPDVPSIVLGNGLLSTALLMYGYGLYRFYQQPPPWVWLLGPVLAVVAWSAVWMTDFRWRAGGLSVLYLLQTLLILRLLWQQRGAQQGRRGHWLLGLGLCLLVGIMLVRLTLVLLDLHHVMQSQQPGLFNTLTYMNAMAYTVLISVGMLMMAQERTEALLAQSERQYRQLIEAANDGICIVQDDRIGYANPRMCQLFGHSADSIVGSTIQDLVAEEDWPRLQAKHLDRLSGKDADWRYTARMRTRHAGLRWFEINGVRINWQGRSATLNFFDDITERRHREASAQQQAQHDALAQQRPERSLLLERLKQAQQSAARATPTS